MFIFLRAALNKNIKRVIVNVDFHAFTKLDLELLDEHNKGKRRHEKTIDPSIYINQAKDPVRKYKYLLGVKSAKDIIKKTWVDKHYRYMLADSRFNGPGALAQRNKIYQEDLLDLKKEEKKYSFKSRQEEFKKLFNDYPNVNFTAVTMPIHVEYLQAIKRNKSMDAYKTWLLEQVQTFGEVLHYTHPGEFNKDESNFYDPFHPFPEALEAVGLEIDAYITRKTPLKLGVLLNQSNINSYLEGLDAFLR